MLSHLLWRVLLEFRAYRLAIAGYVALLVLASIAGIGVPLVTKSLIDNEFRPQDLVLLLFLGLFHAAADSLGKMSGFLIGGRITYDLRVRLFEHVQTMPLGFFARSKSGALTSRIGTDVVGAQGLLQNIFGSLAANILTLVTATVAMFALSPLTALLVLALAPVLLIPVRVYGRRMREIGRRQAQSSSDMQGHLSEWLNVGGSLLRLLFGTHGRELAAFEQRAARHRDVMRDRNLNFGTSQLLLASLGVIGYVCAYLIGGFGVANGDLTVGTVVALAALVRVAYEPLTNFATHGVDLQTGLVAFERVYEVLDFRPPSRVTAPQPDPDLMPAPEPGSESGSERVPRQPVRTLEVRSLSFGFPSALESTLPSLLGTSTGVSPGGSDDEPTGEPTGDGQTLDGITFTASAGTTTAIVGPTGAGKSTLLALISGLYEPSAGAVLLDGRDLGSITAGDRRAAVGVVTQDAYLLNDTMRANLLLAKPDATDQDLANACEQASLTEVIAGLPEELDTMMGDHGYRLSGGERQRVALARVFLQSTPIVLLDEATAHLDSRTEKRIQAALTSLQKGRIVVVVAHRLSTIEHADQIVVLDRGRIVERGTHDSLLASGILYPKLAKAKKVTT